MNTVLRHVAAIALAALLAACGGGGNSTSSSVSGPGLNTLGLSPAVSTPSPFQQLDNNLVVRVEQGPGGFGIDTNLLFATVTVCVPNDPTHCAVIDHVLVDTGSVGLRVLASKVQGVALPPIQLSSSPPQNAWECFPFVIGGLWGPIVAADVVLGPQATVSPVAIQLIDDLNMLSPTANCNAIVHSTATQSNILSSASTLGANGILGIGSTNLDCGLYCKQGTYQDLPNVTTGSSVLYYQCAPGETDPARCNLAPMDSPLQVHNPVDALGSDFNAGVVLAMPAIPDSQPGAATATGELILGLGTRANNTLNTSPATTATRVMLGTGVSANPDSYLSVTTQYGSTLYYNSYLDTGTNAILFYNPSLPVCSSSTWYCPSTNLTVGATISDGDTPTANQVAVPFRIGNFEALNATSNTAFSNAVGYVATASGVPDTTTFAWGMPFFYGKRVYMSIWDITTLSNPPWYAWTPI